MISTENRFARFLGSKTIRRFLGLHENNVNLMEIMDNQTILLVDLGASQDLDRDSARVFACLLLNEFFETAMLRANRSEGAEKPKHYVLILDEFQEMISEDVSAMLDQVRKGGLHMVLAHQHLGHLAENPKLRKSILTNARIRIAFGGLDYEDASLLANEMFLPDLNERQIKKAIYHTAHIYEEQTRIHRSKSTSVGSSEGTNWSTGSHVDLAVSRGSAKSIGETEGSGTASARSRSEGKLDSSSESTGMPLDLRFGGAQPTEGWFAKAEGSGTSSQEGVVESSSEFSARTESETVSESSSETSGTSESRGGSAGRSASESAGESEVPVWVPIPVQELSSESEWTREEKVSRVAEMLKNSHERHCFIKLDTEKTQPMLVPFVSDACKSETTLLDYVQEVYKAQGAISADQADLRIERAAQRFLAAPSIDVSPVEGDRPKKSKTNKKNSSPTLWDVVPNEG